jgi:hypothetical protein
MGRVCSFIIITKSLIILMICETIQKNCIVYQIIYFGKMIIFYIIHLTKTDHLVNNPSAKLLFIIQSMYRNGLFIYNPCTKLDCLTYNPVTNWII